jgi:hypothetical protein
MNEYTPLQGGQVYLGPAIQEEDGFTGHELFVKVGDKYVSIGFVMLDEDGLIVGHYESKEALNAALDARRKNRMMKP